jgi:hypothetical protein
VVADWLSLQSPVACGDGGGVAGVTVRGGGAGAAGVTSVAEDDFAS